MKRFFNARVPSFDAGAINQTIARALASAGLDTSSGPMRSVTDAIKRALSRGGVPDAAGAPPVGEQVIDVEVQVVDDRQDGLGEAKPKPPIDESTPCGTFDSFSFSNRAGSRAYKLYVPARIAQVPPPMVVMLHGCTQSAHDFAEGTRMNQLAEEHGFLVVYPEQAAGANPSKCWNWFKAQDQVRDAGEPSLIAGIVREVAQRHGADPRRIFVAGLSAGAAMAVILGETYPELFAGVGAHSGLPYGSAHDIPSAMAAMKAGRGAMAGLHGLPGADAPEPRKLEQAVPTIVFHGDRDHTVQQANGAEIVRQAAAAFAAEMGEGARPSHTKRGMSTGGRSYTCTTYADAEGQPHIESWTVHGAGHAWSGGSANGSYADVNGPDASAEMVRFFLSLPRSGSA
jgi:poly(hydroxyalkanoate) depolymerase family esterase